jgi:MoaA/NifB/PqqE/SkfB family radical SAM enzyme
MKLTSLPRKIRRGLPYLAKELRAVVSDRTPMFIGLPRVVHIWRNAPCNAKCIMCDYGFLKGEELRKLFHSRFTDDYFPPALEQIAELCGRGTMVSYMGGEATTSKHLVDWVEQAGRLGLDFRFTTNGYIMNQEMASRFIAAGLFNIGVSLESLDPAINELIRPYPNGTAKTVQAIDILLRERERQKKFLSINVKTVLTEVNLESFLEIIERYGKIDGMMVTPQAFEGMAGMPEETKHKLFPKDLERFRRVLERIKELKAEGYNVHVTERALDEMLKAYLEDKDHKATMHNKKLLMDPSEPKCNIGTDNMWIQDGYIKLCPYHPPVGDFLEGKQTLKEIWEGEMTKRVRAQTRACRRLCTISCLRRTPLRHKVQTFLKIA